MKKQDLSIPLDFKETTVVDAEFIKNYNIMVKELNAVVKAFPLKRLSGEIASVVLPAATEVRVSHSLKSIPKYRLILGQTGDAVVTDVKEKWTVEYITLFNNSAVEVTLDLMIIRE